MSDHSHAPDVHAYTVPETGQIMFVSHADAVPATITTESSTDYRKYPPEDESLIDIIVPSRNRLVFTRECLSTLLRTTDWSLVRCLWLYDDQSEDGTGTYLDEIAPTFRAKGVAVTVLHGKYNSPLAVLLDCVKDNPCGLIAKVDNDALMPPDWLRIAASTITSDPTVDLLGIGYRSELAPLSYQGPFTITPSLFIGGIGLFRMRALRQIQPRDYHNREFNGIDQSSMKVGWLTPNLPVILLDWVPFDPWVGLSVEYESRGWQRKWGRYSNDNTELWQWWLTQRETYS